MSPDPKISWPHAPVHKLSEAGTYFATAGTYKKLHHFRGAERLAVLQRGLLAVAKEFGRQLEAWAVFSNHYHFVAHSPATDAGAEILPLMLGKLHSKTASWVNRLDGSDGRHVWHYYWESRLTYQQSYLSRLNYTHNNAVRHGLVSRACLYPWCSASWFEQTATQAQVKTINGLKTDKVRVFDDFEPDTEW